MKLKDKDKTLIIDYLKRFHRGYTRDEIEYLYKYIEKDVNIDITKEPDYVLQILSVLEILDEKNDVYKYLFKEICKYHDIKQNILEIGCGKYPSLARIIAKKQIKIKQGTITVYDPKLVLTNAYPLKLKRERFNYGTNLNRFGLIIGINPGDNIEAIIEKSNEEHKDLFLGLSADYYGFEQSTYSYTNWIDYVKKLIKEDTAEHEIKELLVPENLRRKQIVLSKKIKHEN